MNRLHTATRLAHKYRPLLQLALLAVGLLAVGLGGGAPFCFPDEAGC